MRLVSAAFRLILLCSFSASASAVSTAPLQAINTYIEENGQCSGDLVAWNRKYLETTRSGQTPRAFYYHAIALQEWGACGRPYLKRIFSEFSKAWLIYGHGKVTEAELEAKEAELIRLLFSALKAGDQGIKLVERYEDEISWKLLNLVPDRQYYNCTYFGDTPQCED